MSEFISFKEMVKLQNEVDEKRTLRNMQTHKRNREYDALSIENDLVKTTRQFELLHSFVQAIADGRRSEADAQWEAAHVLKVVNNIDDGKYEIEYIGTIGDTIHNLILDKHNPHHIWITIKRADTVDGVESTVLVNYNKFDSDIPLIVGSPIQVTVYGDVIKGVVSDDRSSDSSK